MESLNVDEAGLHKLVCETEFKLENVQQRQIALKVLFFSEVLDSVLGDLMTHKLTD